MNDKPKKTTDNSNLIAFRISENDAILLRKRAEDSGFSTVNEMVKKDLLSFYGLLDNDSDLLGNKETLETMLERIVEHQVKLRMSNEFTPIATDLNARIHNIETQLQSVNKIVIASHSEVNNSSNKPVTTSVTAEPRSVTNNVNKTVTPSVVGISQAPTVNTVSRNRAVTQTIDPKNRKTIVEMADYGGVDEAIVEGWIKDFRDNGRLSTLMPIGWTIDLESDPVTFVHTGYKKL